MANIDNLNFKVIIDDKEFNKKISQLERDAKKFNTNMSSLLHVRKASAQISQQELQNNRRALQANVDILRAEEKINREKIKTEGLQRRINAQIDRGANSARRMSTSFSSVAGPFMQLAAFGGVTSLITSLVRITGEFELQKTTLGAMLGDLGAAEHVLTRIQGLAVNSPFTYKELTGYAKQLTAFAVPEEELFDTVNMIADLSAGLGVAADRLILAYGQVKSAAFLRGQEVRQFTEAGIPILQELAEEFEKLEDRAVGVGEVFDMIASRQVSFEMVRDVLKEMTSEGGKFYNMQELQSNTLKGKLSKLKDQWEMALNEIGQKNGTVIHKSIDGLIDLVKNWEKVGKILRTVIITYGAYKVALLAAWGIEKLITAGKMIKTFATGIKVTHSFTAAIKGMNLSLSATLGFVGLLGGLIFAFATNTDDAAESTRDLDAELQDMHETAEDMVGSFDAAISYLQSLTRGTEAYRNAINRINDAYGSYLPNLLTEADSYEEIAEKANLARIAIREKTRQEMAEKLKNQFKYNGKALQEYQKAFNDMMDAQYAQYGSIGPLFVRLAAEEIAKSSGTDGIVTDDEIDEIFKKHFEKYVKNRIVYLGEYQRLGLEYFRALAEAEKAVNREVNMIFSENPYDSLEEFWGVDDLEKKKAEALAELDKRELSSSERRNEELKIEKQHLRDLISLYTSLGNTHMANETKKKLERLETFWKSWRGRVQNLLLNKGYSDQKSFGLWPTDTKSSTDYIEELLKDYKDVTDKLDKLHFDPSTQKSLKEQKAIIEAIAGLLNVDLTSEGKTELEKKIDALSALKKAYDDLKTLNLSDSTIIDLLKGNFPDVVSTYGDAFIETLNFTDRILEFARELKKADPNKANTPLQSLGLDNVSQTKSTINEVLSAAKKYFEAIRKWKTADFSIEGEGVAFDIGKIANQLSTKFNEIDLKAKNITESLNQIDLTDAVAIESIKNTFEKEFGEGTWDAFYEEFMVKGEQAIKNFSNMEKEYEKKLAQDKLDNIANNYVKDSLENLDLSHWGDKSINQIEAIRQRISELMGSDIVLPKSTMDELNRLGLSLDDAREKIKELLGEKYDTATVEKFKALAKVANQVSSIVKTLGQDLEELGDTIDNNFLRDLGNSLETFQELAKIVTECDSLMQAMGKSAEEATSETADAVEETAEAAKEVANSSDLITLAIKLAAMLISKITEGINNSQKALIEARDAAIEYSKALNQIEYNQMKESYETIFGTDEYKQAVNAMEMASKYLQSSLDATKDIKTTTQEIRDALDMSDWAKFSKGAWETAEMVRGLGLGDILVDARTNWQKFWGIGNELVNSINIYDFIDEEGKLKGEELREWLKVNGDNISQDNKEALERMLNDYDLYTQAVEDATAYLSNIFGSVADDMADKFIEAFKASGEAALDYADIMDSVATDVARSLIKSMLIDNIFTPEKIKDITDLFLGGDQAGAMAVVDEAMKTAQALTPRIQAVLESLEPYFQMEGSEGLASGIKGMTEDTANLLASYLNAIRADISYSRTLWERMDANTQQIATILAGFSAPTLIDYQKKIEANTADIAFNTQRILIELQSVITSEGGASAIRMYS